MSDPNFTQSQKFLIGLLSAHLRMMECPDRKVGMELWQHTLKYAIDQRVALILYSHLKNRQQDVPEPILQKLKKLYHHNAVDNLRMEKELQFIDGLFKLHDIPILPIKGIILSHVLYNDPIIRPVVDLDILVRMEHLQQAADQLLTRGYTWLNEHTWAHLRAYRRISHHLGLVQRDRRIILELHSRLIQLNRARSMDDEGIWRRARKIRMGEMEYLMMSAEDLVAYLVCHSAKEYFGSLLQIYEIAMLLLRSREIDGALLWQRAREHHCCRRLRICLELINEVFALDKIPQPGIENSSVMTSLPKTEPDLFLQPMTRAEKKLLQLVTRYFYRQDIDSLEAKPKKLWFDISIADNHRDRLLILWHKIMLLLVKFTASPKHTQPTPPQFSAQL